MTSGLRRKGHGQAVVLLLKAIAIYQQTGEGRKEAAAFYESLALLAM